MSALSIQVPFPVFQDRDGQPLENGYIWIGQPNLNPQTNPVVAYYDEALTIVAPQPLRTLNGYISRAGTPAQVYVDAVNFSILVQDSKGSMVYNFPDGTGINPDACGVTYDPPFTGAVAYPVCEKLEQYISAFDFMTSAEIADVQSFTASIDVTTALQAFFDACQDGRGYMPPGKYKITSTLNLYPQYSYNIEGSVFRNTANAGTVIHNAGTGTAIFLNNEPYTPPNFDSQIRLSNLTVSGNPSSEHGIFADHVMIYLENVWLTGHGNHGLFLQRAYGSSFRQVTCANNYMHGALISTAGNLMHFDHCVFNGNSILDGYAGMRLSAVPDPLAENFAVVFTSCDFTGNGTTPGVTTAIGAQVGEVYSASFIGCYWESNKSSNLYADSTAKNLTVVGCYFQDADNDIADIDGLIYENNFHLQVSTPTQINISGGMPTSRLPTRMFGNTYSGGATPNPQAGVTENIQLWYSSPPSGGTWKRGDIIWNANFQDVGQNQSWVCITPGTPGTWLATPQIPAVSGDNGDNDITLTPFLSFPTQMWKTPLSNNRIVTLSSTGIQVGVKWRAVRTSASTGAFTLNVGGLKSLAAGQWCDVEYDGSAWQLTAFGSL